MSEHLTDGQQWVICIATFVLMILWHLRKRPVCQKSVPKAEAYVLPWNEPIYQEMHQLFVERQVEKFKSDLARRRDLDIT